MLFFREQIKEMFPVFFNGKHYPKGLELLSTSFDKSRPSSLGYKILSSLHSLESLISYSDLLNLKNLKHLLK